MRCDYRTRHTLTFVHLFRQKRNFRAHLRQHARVNLIEAHFHTDRGLGPIHRRHGARHHATKTFTGQCFQLYLTRLLQPHLAHAGLRHVGLDLQRTHIRHGHYGCLRAGGRRERRNHVADIRILGQHHTVKRRADQRLLDRHGCRTHTGLRHRDGRLLRVNTGARFFLTSHHHIVRCRRHKVLGEQIA